MQNAQPVAAGSLSGMVRRSVIAVIRLMTNSSFVGCRTGLSAVIRIEQHDQVPCDIPETGSFEIRRSLFCGSQLFDP
jgi:hypothetical protein